VHISAEALISEHTFEVPNKVPSKRPKGRPLGALPCKNPNIDYKEVRKRVRAFVTQKAFFGAVMEKAINNAHKIVYSEHTRAIHRTLYAHRTHIGINRDITAWIVLLSTVNLTASSDKNWFKCFVNLTRLDEIAGYESLSRGSRFLKLFCKTDLIRARYKQSKINKEMKYCEIYISRKAFELAEVTNIELDSEIDRKQRNDKRRLSQPGTREYEDARALAKKANRHLYAVEKEQRIRRKEQAKAESESRHQKRKDEELKKEFIALLTKLQGDYPNKSFPEIKELAKKRSPHLASYLGHPPPSK